MKLLNYKFYPFYGVGVLNSDGDVCDIHGAYLAYLRESGKDTDIYIDTLTFRDMKKLLSNGEEAIKAVKNAINYVEANLEKSKKEKLIIPIEQVQLLAPILNPEKIVCVGRNYEEHVKEANRTVPEYPEFFSVFRTAINHPNADVKIPEVSEMVDWEGELAVIIGKKGHSIPEAQAMDYVAGYTIFNDVSVRDYQLRTTQFMAGKTFDGHAPMGPYLVLKDEIPDPHDLEIKTEVNGKVVQHDNSKNMIFKIPNIISEMSRIWTIEPGDVLSTGTMAGVGHAMKPPRYLKDGDIVSITIDKLGRLVNRFVK